MTAVLKRYVGTDSGTALHGSVHQRPVFPVVEQHVHVGAGQAVAESIQVYLNVQRDGHASGAHDAQQDGQIVMAAAAHETHMDGMPGLAALFRRPGGDGHALGGKLLVGDLIDDVVLLVAEINPVAIFPAGVLYQIPDGLCVFTCDHNLSSPLKMVGLQI